LGGRHCRSSAGPASDGGNPSIHTSSSFVALLQATGPGRPGHSQNACGLATIVAGGPFPPRTTPWTVGQSRSTPECEVGSPSRASRRSFPVAGPLRRVGRRPSSARSAILLARFSPTEFPDYELSLPRLLQPPSLPGKATARDPERWPRPFLLYLGSKVTSTVTCRNDDTHVLSRFQAAVPRTDHAHQLGARP